jgi:hypothetical protein
LGAFFSFSLFPFPSLTLHPPRSTTFTGIAYGSSRLFSGQVRQILTWPGSYETYRKVPTCILYEQHDPEQEAKVVAWGIEAKNATVTRGLIKCVFSSLSLLISVTNLSLTPFSYRPTDANGSNSSSPPNRSVQAFPTHGSPLSQSARTSSMSSVISSDVCGGMRGG